MLRLEVIFLRLGVSQCYVSGLVFLRLVVNQSYVLGLVSVSFKD